LSSHKGVNSLPRMLKILPPPLQQFHRTDDTPHRHRNIRHVCARARRSTANARPVYARCMYAQLALLVIDTATDSIDAAAQCSSISDRSINSSRCSHAMPMHIQVALALSRYRPLVDSRLIYNY
jgi:hypothetical protein